jgi:hypothetical protein
MLARWCIPDRYQKSKESYHKKSTSAIKHRTWYFWASRIVELMMRMGGGLCLLLHLVGLHPRLLRQVARALESLNALLLSIYTF